MLALLVAAFIFVLCLTMLEFAERDSHFAYTQDNNNLAYYLARTGLQYYVVRAEYFTPDTPLKITPFPSSQNAYFTAEIYSTSGDVRSVGVVANDSGTIVAQRTLLVPSGNFPTVIDVSR